MAKMTVDELKNEISKNIKELGLHEALSQNVIDEIKNKIIAKINLQKAQSDIPQIIPEYGNGPIMPAGTREFPHEELLDTINPKNPEEGEYGIEPGGENMLDQEYEPIIATPDMPDMFNQIKPEKVVVFDYNEVAAEGGENLANKPLRLYNDPDIKRSIKQLWKSEGKSKAEVYVAKFEKIGEVEYNYIQQTAKFTDNIPEQEVVEQPYKNNPYEEKPKPDISYPSHDINWKNNNTNFNDRPNQQHSQTVKPMEESLKMEDIAGVNASYNKVNTPKLIKEAMGGNKKDCVTLLNESNEVQSWELDGKIYYTPKKFITTTKCYING